MYRPPPWLTEAFSPPATSSLGRCRLRSQKPQFCDDSSRSWPPIDCSSAIPHDSRHLHLRSQHSRLVSTEYRSHQACSTLNMAVADYFRYPRSSVAEAWCCMVGEGGSGCLCWSHCADRDRTNIAMTLPLTDPAKTAMHACH